MAIWPFNRKSGGAHEEQRAFTGWPWDTGGPPPYIAVGVQRALSLVPVFGAARILGDNVASLYPAVYTADKEGVWHKQPTPSLFVNPSVHGTLFDWLQRGTHSMVLQGDAIGYTTARDSYGFPTMIEWLNPEEVSVQDGSQGNAAYSSATGVDYSSTANSGPGSFMDPLWFWRGRRLDVADLVHIPWFTMPYKVRGLSPIAAYQTVANVGLGAQDFASAWFLHGGVPPGTFRNTKQVVSKEDSDTITARITSRLQQRKPLVFGSDWEYTPIGINPSDAAFIETAQLTANHIAVIYGLPPEMLGGQAGGNLTYNTVAMNALNFLTFSLRPWLVRWEYALSSLFPRGRFVKFVTAELLRMDQLTKAQVDQMSLGGAHNGAPWRTQNEVRASNDEPPLDGGNTLYGPAGAPETPPEETPAPAAAALAAQPAPNGQRSSVYGPAAYMDILRKRPNDPIGVNGHTPFAVPN